MEVSETRYAGDLSDQERNYAISWHERQEKLKQEYRSAAIEVSNTVMRALLTLNGGAAIAFATIVAAMVSRPEVYERAMPVLLQPMIAFASGAGLAVLAGGIAYLTHSADAAAASSFRYVWSHPYLDRQSDHARWHRRARFFNWLGVVVALSALGAFFVGVGLLAGAMLTLVAR